MSALLFGQVLKFQMDSKTRKLVLLKMVDACEDDGTRIYPSIKTIAETAECSRRHAQRTVRSFEEIGLIELVREGGAGPRSPNEYRLVLNEFFELRRLGWTAYAGKKHSENSDLDKGDMESPSKGDMVEPIRATSGTDKGDTSCRPTPPDPSKDSLTDEGDTHEDVAEREKSSPSNIQFIPPKTADYGEVKGFVLRMARAYPTGFADNLDDAKRASDALTAEERRAAESDLTRWVAFCRAEGRRHLPSLASYLREKRWTLLPDPPKTVDDGKVEIKRYSRAFWALFWRHDRADRDPESFWLRGLAGAWRVEKNLAPTADEEAALVAVNTTSPAFDTWTVYVTERWPSMRLRFRRPDHVAVIWCPSEWPPGVEQTKAEEVVS